MSTLAPCPPPATLVRSDADQAARRRLPLLIADHDHAAQAAAMPDVEHELHVHARRTAVALGLDPGDPTVINRLLDYGRGCYIHGHMDATAEHDHPRTALATHLQNGAAS